ncbi:MAG: DUF479 domain-containing protein [Planctomycetes bacterium]|nr:DUF479 domain-containing protein [Planctomycetota bacterium]
MNWLAHLRLAPPDPLLRIGNLCGDFVRGVDLAELHPMIRRGVEQHRALDAFVDAHAVMRRSRRRLQSHRYAGVLVDVCYDHFLARDWHELGDGRPLREFAAEVHAQLDAHAALLPPRLRQALPFMRAEGWLASYAELDGVDRIFARMSGRSPRRRPLLQGGELLRRHYAELGADFAALWPELLLRVG